MGQLELGLEFEVGELPEQLAATLQEFYLRGYRYIARDKDMDTVTCFSLEPKKYRDGEFWGYTDPEVPGVLPAYPLLGTELPDIKWTNRSATLIEVYLGERMTERGMS